MTKRNSDRRETGLALHAQEQAAYHAWREWPVFLELRRKELLAHQATSTTKAPAQLDTPKKSVAPATARTTSTRKGTS